MELPWVAEPVCIRCGKPIASPEKALCADCARTDHAFTEGRAALLYEKGIRLSVNRMKFYNHREYLQAVLLARALSELCRIPVLEDVLVRTRYTKASRKLGREHRLANLRGAFTVRQRESLPQSVLLVDDIYTTGMTMDHASAALRKAGVTQIYFLTLCTGRGAE